MNDLIIVENKHKLITYEELLESDKYMLLSTGGTITRIKDSSSKKWSINESSKIYLEKIKEVAATCEKVFLAMDDDLEGERLSWDVLEYLGSGNNIYRIVPRELSKKAIVNSIKNARNIDKKIIDAQMTRKYIEKLVGTNISHAMQWWFEKERVFEKSITDNIGVGRVSSPALSLIVEAEEKIDTFIPRYYNRVAVDYFINNTQFSVKNKLKFTKDKKEELLALMNMTKNEKHIISKFERSTKDKVPPPPLNAAWLQRAANYQFQLTPKETMKIAKELYEGIEIDGKTIGLITYPKTDSINISDKIAVEIMQLLMKKYGEEFTLTSKRTYKKTTNDNKEAIRPISFKTEFFPKNVRRFLTTKQFILYEFIFLRTLATQMKAAIFDKSELVIEVSGAVYKAVANNIIFEGWLTIGKYWRDDETEDMEEVTIPDGLIVGNEIRPIEVRTYEIKERTPWRYGEGRFITTLEKYSIANASFVSEITNYLRNKKYIEIHKGMIYPTELGKKVYYFMKQFAPWLVDLDLIEKFEMDIKAISIGDIEKKDVIAEYENYKNDSLAKIGYVSQEDAPDQWLIDKAQKIAKQKGQILRQEILGSKVRVRHYIEANKEGVKTLGICPACKKGEIFIDEKGYRCNNHECNFILWNDGIKRFLNAFSKNLPDSVIPEYISIILKKGKCYINDLYSSKKDKFFNSFVEIKYSEEYKNWSLSLLYDNTPKKEKIVDFMPTARAVNNTDDKIEQENAYLKEQLEKAQREKRLILEKSKKDPLTRAYTKGCFIEDIENIFKQQKASLSLAFIDGDKFKNVNDTYGHQAGDKVLQFLVDKMFRGAEESTSSKVYRYGGEEFIILFIEKSKKDVISCINGIRESIEKDEVKWEDQIIRMTISSGVAFCREEDTVESLLGRADDAVYRAKENGRNRIELEI